MAREDERIVYFGETDFRNKKIRFGIKAKDRGRHMYVIGKTGMGKSTLLENLVVQDIQNGEGVGFIDPHGSSAETLLSYVPEHRIKDVVYFAPFDQEYPIAFNVMEQVGKDQRALVASGLIAAFKKVWVDAWSARMEYILNNILLALLETPGSTLLGVNRMLSDKDFRKMVIANITDPSVRSFWVDEFAKYSEKFMVEAGAAIQNKIGQFASNPIIRNILGQTESTFNIREIMDNKKIFIMNLSKGRMGEGNANLIGGMLITKIYLAAMSRADTPLEVMKNLPNFYLYVDEFQSFANESFADILSEARKYKLSLTIAHQYIEQMSDEVRAAVFGNVGTMVTFRVGSYDAGVLEKEFAPDITAEDIVNLGFAQVYLRLMIDGIGSAPFSATTLPPIQPLATNFKDDVIAYSRSTYARPRADVEDQIRKWHEPVELPRKERDADKRPDRAPRPGGHGSTDRGEYTPRPRGKRIETEQKERPKPVALSTLKTEKKKDKGPSASNMSGLKEALAAAMETSGRSYDKDMKQGLQREQQKEPEQKSEKSTPTEDKKDNVAPKVQPHENVKKDVPAPGETQKKVDLGPPKEVPEDVLRGVLDEEN